jgi:hypothetical protein
MSSTTPAPTKSSNEKCPLQPPPPIFLSPSTTNQTSSDVQDKRREEVHAELTLDLDSIQCLDLNLSESDQETFRQKVWRYIFSYYFREKAAWYRLVFIYYIIKREKKIKYITISSSTSTRVWRAAKGYK